MKILMGAEAGGLPGRLAGAPGTDLYHSVARLTQGIPKGAKL